VGVDYGARSGEEGVMKPPTANGLTLRCKPGIMCLSRIGHSRCASLFVVHYNLNTQFATSATTAHSFLSGTVYRALRSLCVLGAA